MTLLGMDTPTLICAAAGVTGALLIAQSHMQSKLLRSRIAAGLGTVVFDRATGLYSAAATMQCIRAEVNRARRMGHRLDIHVGCSPDETHIDTAGRELATSIPLGAVGLRLGRTALAVLSCDQLDTTAAVDAASDLRWHHARVNPDEHAEAAALGFIAEATRVA